jgi:hypothetical protein
MGIRLGDCSRCSLFLRCALVDGSFVRGGTKHNITHLSPQSFRSLLSDPFVCVCVIVWYKSIVIICVAIVVLLSSSLLVHGVTDELTNKQYLPSIARLIEEL